MNGMKNENDGKTPLAVNLAALRKIHGLSQEKAAERVGVTRQALAKWEAGESTPDILHCDALAALYDVTLDDLVRFDQAREGVGVPPKGKHLFGMVQVGERGQVVLPKRARDVMGLKHGDTLVVLGETASDWPGLALMKSDDFLRMAGMTPGDYDRESAK